MMKRLLIGLGIALATLWSVATFAAESIGVVDIQQIFQNSPQVKKVNDSLKKQFSSRRDNIVKLGKTMQDDAQKYEKNKTIMSSKDANALKDKVAQEQRDLQQEQTKFQQDLYEAQNKQMGVLMVQLKDIVKKVAADKKLTVVIPKNSVVYSDNSLDITSDVMDKLK
jgi:outer membrane protein